MCISIRMLAGRCPAFFPGFPPRLAVQPCFTPLASKVACGRLAHETGSQRCAQMPSRSLVRTGGLRVGGALQLSSKEASAEVVRKGPMALRMCQLLDRGSNRMIANSLAHAVGEME